MTYISFGVVELDGFLIFSPKTLLDKAKEGEAWKTFIIYEIDTKQVFMRPSCEVALSDTTISALAEEEGYRTIHYCCKEEENEIHAFFDADFFANNDRIKSDLVQAILLTKLNIAKTAQSYLNGTIEVVE